MIPIWFVFVLIKAKPKSSKYHYKKVNLSDLDFPEVEEDEAIKEEQSSEEFTVKMPKGGWQSGKAVPLTDLDNLVNAPEVTQ